MSAEDWPGVHPNDYLLEKVYTRKDLEDEVRAAESAGRVAERTRCAQLLYRAQRGNEKGGSEADHIRATVLLGMREAIDRGGACRETDPYVKLYSRNDLHFVIAAAEAERVRERERVCALVEELMKDFLARVQQEAAEVERARIVALMRDRTAEIFAMDGDSPAHKAVEGLLRRLEGL